MSDDKALKHVEDLELTDDGAAKITGGGAKVTAAERPTETVTLSYGKVEYVYSQ